MFIDKDCAVYKINSNPVYLSSVNTCYGRNTVAIINDNIYYIGDCDPNISNAIFSYEKIYHVNLDEEELRQVLIDNNLMSEAI